MRKLLYLPAILFITLISCSKKNETKHQALVTINEKVYSTVVIGNQTWTAENYDGPGGTASTRNDEAAIGKYYTLEEMQALTLPAGWRVPSEADCITLLKSQGTLIWEDEYGALLDSVSSKYLRSTTGWYLPGTNKSGFNALPAGKYQAFANEFQDYKSTANFWTTTIGIPEDAQTWFIMDFSGFYDSYGTGGAPNSYARVSSSRLVEPYGYSLRFVKDN
ncbi:FISUMP domain-containing protein [Mucilaginibacter sp.]|uniref:FISUMP domain-containing protein n=1 Tax=Mucilaginibacter sp. TaxID=1882438 RepID=UPI002620D8CA|nr:FISUMP domain-containing protein [Mucilaginibacter sp.]MDB4918813.1 hypothetical protein [Mucilaginibacter sp.]